MPDQQTYIANSLIQHGPDSNRVYLMKLAAQDDPANIADATLELATQKGYTKVFAKIPLNAEPAFLARGFLREGMIPGFYQGQQAAVFLACFLAPERTACNIRPQTQSIITLAQSKADSPAPPTLAPEYSIRKATPEDALPLANLYQSVFASYPFPIHDPQYLRDTMRSHIHYFTICHHHRIIAAASAETDPDSLNAEMTDFATDKQHLGQALAVHLLKHMDTEMKQAGIKTLYTIARAISPGINITFAKCRYRFGGTLTHNTQIAGQIESMNLWYKNIAD